MPIYFSWFITALLLVGGGPTNHTLPQSGRLLYCVPWRFFANDAVPTHALPANSRFSVDTFTFSPSLMKRGTRISRPVSNLAVLVPPPEESPRIAGSV